MSDKKRLYPEERDLQSFIQSRHQKGLMWRLTFQISTIVAIVALMALLYNIIIGGFGYVAVQNKIDEADLVLKVEENRMVDAPNTMSSEDDKELVDGIEGNPNAVGFFGYAYYANETETLRTVSIDGIAPTRETAANNEYLFARPLYIYTTDKIMQENPHVAAYVNYYLSNLTELVDKSGYFPTNSEALERNIQTWLTANQQQGVELPAVDIDALEAESELVIAGSSTVYPLSRGAAIAFRRNGYEGQIKLDNVGTSAGFRAFCDPNGLNVANASRAINRTEVEECARAKIGEVLEFEVGTDALALVVSQENDFLESVTLDELRQIFTTAETWSEVNPDWPNEPIERFIPGLDSGTLDFFAETVFSRGLDDLPSETLIAVLENNLSAGLIRRLNGEQPLVERSEAELRELITARVLEPSVVASWTLSESLMNRNEIETEVAGITNGRLEWRNWLNWNFLTTAQSSTPELAGIRTALFGTLWVVFITILIALPLGVGAAIYLEEYAGSVKNPFLRSVNGIIQTNINNLAGVPSIIYGLLGLAIFVRAIEPITSGTMFGIGDPTTANGRTVLAASLTLALLILPLIIINAQEAIRAVPNSLRQAGMGLGATKWQTIWHHVIPAAIPGILTGNILAMSRAIGETAPLVVIGASTFITVDPTSPFAKFTTLPIQIYQWTARPQDEFRNIAAAAIIVLLLLLFTLNASAVLLRNHYSRRA